MFFIFLYINFRFRQRKSTKKDSYVLHIFEYSRNFSHILWCTPVRKTKVRYSIRINNTIVIGKSTLFLLLDRINFSPQLCKYHLLSLSLSLSYVVFLSYFSCLFLHFFRSSDTLFLFAVNLHVFKLYVRMQMTLKLKSILNL